MKTLLKVATFIGVFLAAGFLSAQTCSTSNPCVPVQVSGTFGNTATLYKCVGGTTGCNFVTLAAFIANPSTVSQWSVAGTFPQKATTVSYNDPEAYGALVNYAASETIAGGAASPVSGIVVFQMPSQTQAPTLKAGPSIVTTGTIGPQ